MARVPTRGVRAVSYAALLGIAALGACSGSTGSPAAPAAVASPSSGSSGSPDATVRDAVAPAALLALVGRVVQSGTDAGIAGAFVVGELGGKVWSSADATTAVDPQIAVGAITDDAGGFSLAVTAGPVGLYAMAAGAWERWTVVRAPVGSSGLALPLDPIPDGVLRPSVTGLTASPSLAAPGQIVSFAAAVAAGASKDPLSDAIFLVEPVSGFGGALVPPAPALPGGPYPDGDYNRLVTVPTTPGVYAYTLVAVSIGGVMSLPASCLVTVATTPPFPDASSLDDAGVFLDGGGLPDGRY